MSTSLWRAAQRIGILATLGLVALLLFSPETGLTALWDVAVPLLPAVFLIQPAVWRAVCPLATLNMAGNRRYGGRVLDNGRVPVAGTIGILLLGLMVPARRFLFNVDGPALAATIVAVGALALVLGTMFEKKAGFCSGICPVLPVERLYGQHPLVEMRNPRCAPCTLCTTRGCLDIAQSKAIAQVLGRERKSHGWLRSHFGIFAAAFPGFIVGYNLLPDGGVTGIPVVYLTVGVASVLSYLTTQAVVRIARLHAMQALRGLAATSFALYYWFAAATVTVHLGLPPSAPAFIRGAALTLLLVWFWRPGPAARTGPA